MRNMPSPAVCWVMRKLLQRSSNRKHSQVTAGKAKKALIERAVAVVSGHGHASTTTVGLTNMTAANTRTAAPTAPTTSRSGRGTATSPGASSPGSVRRFVAHSQGRRKGVEK